MLKTEVQKIKSEMQKLIHAPLTDEEARIKEACEQDLYTFTRHAWEHIEAVPFKESAHLQCIAEHLEEVYHRRILDIIFNAPPRCGKTLEVNVMFPAWTWIKRPSERFFCASYAESIALISSRQCRWLIESTWFQKFWGQNFRLLSDANTALRYFNSEKGFRISSSVNGIGTGVGGDCIILDDPNQIMDSESETIREATNDFFSRQLSSRLNDAERTAKIVNQQRTHTRDVTGFALGMDIPNLVHVVLPMEYEPARRTITVPLKSTNGKPWEDWRTEEKELLCPSIITRPGLVRIQSSMDQYAIAGQYQQRPSPEEGGILKKEYFQIWSEDYSPRFDLILQSWDTALTTGELSCYSACTTWGVFNDQNEIPNVMLLDMWYERVEYPELKEMVYRLSRNYHDVVRIAPLKDEGHFRPDWILMEDKMNGLSLIQDLGRMGVNIMRFDPSKYGGSASAKNKIARVRRVSSLLECGRVWLVSQPGNPTQLRKYCDKFLNFCVDYPNGPKESIDIVDTMSQALLKISESGGIYHKYDQLPEPKLPFQNQQKFYPG